MNQDKKIPLTEVFQRLQEQMHYTNPETACDALLRCWMNHPRLHAVTRQGFNLRTRIDGFEWLKQSELDAFAQYCGVDLS